MLTNEIAFSPKIQPFCPDNFLPEELLYFDIETTGLSAQSSYVYLIGCAYCDSNGYHLCQWMTTDPSEEKDLIRIFFEKASHYACLVHYNGTGFDLPFLEKKSKRHALTNPLSTLTSLDLYKYAQKYRRLLLTEDLKLKTMERFFGLPRTDTFSGGELIEVYSGFLGRYKLNSLTGGNKQEEVDALTHVLLLHNAEDVMNLPALTFLLSLSRMYTQVQTSTLSVEQLGNELLLTFPAKWCPARECLLQLPFDSTALTLYFSASEQTVTLRLPIYFGVLKHFYRDYENYYYLPEEDCAMHKSIAEFVDRNYRKKATAATCYTKTEGAFLPFCKKTSKKEAEQVPASFHCFSSDYKSFYEYTTFDESLKTSAERLTQLAKTLLETLLSEDAI